MDALEPGDAAIDFDWDDLRLFLEAAHAGSLSEAARRLDVGQATVSRRIAHLEERLGFALFTRGVEGITLTAEGTGLMHGARAMQEGAVAVAQAARGLADEISGRVRITAPPGVAVDMMAPFAALGRARYPNLRLDVLASLGQLDLARGEADLAVRAAEPREAELLCVARGSARLGVYVAAGSGCHRPGPATLASLDWVGWSPKLAGLPPEGWLRQNVPRFDPVFTADDFLVLQRAAAAGLGAILLPDAQAAFWPTLERVTLAPEEERKLPMSPVYLVAARAGWRSARIRAVGELLSEWMASLAGLTMSRVDA